MSGAGLRASAPGKLVLLGEYAVLLGHPAAVMAVDRRALVELRPAREGRFTVRTFGFSGPGAAFELDRGGRPRWIVTDAAERFALVDAVVSSLAAAGLIRPAAVVPAEIVLDSRAFFQVGRGGSVKLGLGSSAALTAGLTEALLAWLGVDRAAAPAADRLGRLIAIHREVQGGRGSGIDLAACALGGVLRYRFNPDDATGIATPLDLPAGLLRVPVWTGQSASTAGMLGRLEARTKAKDHETLAALADLGGIAAVGLDRIEAGDLAAALDAIGRYGAVMAALGRAAGLEIYTAEHLELRRLAQRSGMRYKPSGAGGGDIGVAFGDDPEAAVGFKVRAAAAGFIPLDLAVDPTGVTVDRLGRTRT
jgi:phosphomevalonate kinase